MQKGIPFLEKGRDQVRIATPGAAPAPTTSGTTGPTGPSNP
jgi:hypothetical protein